jgi:hypothetical protein
MVGFESFADTGADGEVAPIPDLPAPIPERGGLTRTRLRGARWGRQTPPWYWRREWCAENLSSGTSGYVAIIGIAQGNTVLQTREPRRQLELPTVAPRFS